MKNTFRILGIAAFAVIIGITIVACGGGGGDDGPISLTANEWKDGELTSTTPLVQYKFSVKWAEPNYLWWNDSGQGDGFKTGNIKVSAMFNDGEAISSANEVNNGWNSPTLISFVSLNPSDYGKSKTVIVTVEPYEGQFGTYSIAYSTTNTRPASTWDRPPANPVPLVENTWKNGTIADSTAADWDWYTLSVTSGTTYQFWWDERPTSGSGIFTGDIAVTGYYSDGKEAFTETNTTGTTAKSFTPDKSGTVYIRVKLYSSLSGTTYPGTYAIVYSTSSTRPALTLDNIEAEPLVEDTWKYGTIAGTADTDWYKISVTSGTTYRFWWSDSDNNIHTGDIAVTGYKNDQTVAMTQTDSAWTTAKTYTATEDGTLYISVKLYTSYYGTTPGTYGIVYSSTSTTRPAMNLNSVVTAVPLAENTWKDGEITSDGIQWYSMQVTAGSTYRLWTNDSYSGNYAKTGRIYVTGFYSDGNSAFSRDYGLWSYPNSISPGADDTVYIKVTPYSSTSAGTYGVVYSTSTTKPVVTFDVSGAVTLPVNEWKNGQINATSGTDWYKVTVESGKTYRIYWNDSADGDGTKTGNVSVYAYYSDWREIGSRNDGWATPISSFTPAADGTVYLRVFPYSSSSSATTTGTYAVVCTTSTSRPIDTQSINATTLTERQWQTGGITASAKTVWYSFPVSAGTYYVWWNDSDDGDKTKTADVKVTGYGSDGVALSSFSGIDKGWSTSRTITVISAGTVYVLVEPYNTSGTGSTGTFGIAYSTINTRPIDFQSISPTPLAAGTWKHGQITSTAVTDWYSLSVTSGTTYYLWWNENSSGGIHSGNILVSGYYSDNLSAFTAETDTAWATPLSFTATANSTVYINVKIDYSGAGTYGIVYNTTTTRPAININDIIGEPQTLTTAQWQTGEITAQNNIVWYSFPVSVGPYYIWWDDSIQGSGSKTGDVKVSAYNSDGSTRYFTGIDNGWTTPQSFNISGAAGTVYVKVEPYSINGTGTFGIVYNNNSIRPLQ